MSSEATRDRGKLFTNAEKKKPSQPDLQGDCTIDQVDYEIRGYRRGEDLTVNLAPPRGDKNTYPPDVFKGTLDPVEKPKAPKGKKGAPAAPPELGLAWVGIIVSEDAAYRLSATEKQGKTDIYWTLSFERVEKPTAESEWVDDAAETSDSADSAG
jgi:hypothetical protein